MRAATAVALLRANARFWPAVLPDVRRELRGWDLRARAIPDPALRAQALAKLRDERFNTEVAATLATPLPPVRRRDAVAAIVALEVMYDYLDGLTERPVPNPLAAGLQLYRALSDALTPTGPLADHYRHRPRSDDGGYLAALAWTCRRGLSSRPSRAPSQRAVARRRRARTPSRGLAPPSSAPGRSRSPRRRRCAGLRSRPARPPPCWPRTR